ncbi:MAG: insulinase family protein [Rickettsiales bacterium]|jgi:predicted Zn-dependent peptidase|nr:insulinase family protein [Rickettsiales bacterium]
MKYNPSIHKLSNGVTVLLDPMDLETTNVKVQFSTGARDENPNEYGLAHFCEHMLCKGTPRFPTQKFIDEYMDYHAGTKNAGTGMADIQFYGRILAENAGVLIDYLGDQIQNSLFDTDKIEIERKVISDELRRYLDSPAEQLTAFSAQKLFGGATYSANRIIGTFENIASFTREQMLEFMSRRFSAGNCIIGISGKIADAGKMLSDLDKAFGWLKPTDISENSDIHYTPAIAHNSKLDKNNVKLRIYFPDIFEASYENRFMNMCVGKFERNLGKKLYEVVRRENGLVYGFSSSGIGNEKTGVSGFSTETAVGNLEKCVALVARTAYKVYNDNEITADDLERFNRKNKLADADWMESAGRRCDKLISFYHNHGCLYDFYDTVRMSESITRDDVIENSRGYFAGPMSIITQGVDFDSDMKAVWEENFK